MRIEYLHLDGFGTLADVDFAFEPGFNLILGPNEAGKSTLQQAILAMLYGFYSGGRANSNEKTARTLSSLERLPLFRQYSPA